ncbi:MAG TPA: Rieske (2Fe-2S) protein [Rugosimonospora sp.]|nr:Rieske (2Fe-2S) protein [Rugosimonospora sp.]
MRRQEDYDRWDRQPAYEDGGAQDYGYDSYADEPDGGDGGNWGYQQEDERAYAARQRAAARRRQRAQALADAQAHADAEAMAATAMHYAPQPIVNRGTRRRQMALVAVLAGAVSLLGERVIRAFGGSGSASAATMDTGTANMAGGMTGNAPASTAAGGTGGNVLASTTDIPVGGAKIFTAQKVVVTQPTAGTFKAYSTVCTHAGCLLDQVKGDKILCPCHPGVFNLDGTVASGPPPDPLPAKHITVADGKITL